MHTIRLCLAALLCLITIRSAHATPARTTPTPGAGHPDLAAAWRDLRAGQTEQAREHLAAAAPAVRELAEAHLLAGLVHLEREEPADAARELAAIPLDHPLGVVAAYNRILALLALDRDDDAAASARALLAATGAASDRREVIGAAVYNTALVFLSRDRGAVARELLGAIDAHLPGTAAASNARELLAGGSGRPAPDTATCVGAYRGKRYREARACFETLVVAGGPEPELLFAIGYASYQLGEYRPAIAAFEQALLVEPRDGDVLFMLAMARAHQGDHADALREFQAALAAGMETEDPAEARRHVASLEMLLAARASRGWVVTAAAALGYDTYPLPTGGIATGTSSFGEDLSASGFSSVRAGLGYRWPRHDRRSGRLVALTSVGYELGQYLLLSESSTDAWRGRGSGTMIAPSDLSLQTHRVHLGSHRDRGAWRLGARGGAGLELDGSDGFAPLLATLSVVPEVERRWTARTTTAIRAGWTPQRSLAEDLDHLGGHGAFVEARQLVRLRPSVTASAGYRLTSWWLGRRTADPADCPAGEACAIDVPYGHLAHRPVIGVVVELGRVRLGAEAALEARFYRGDGVYLQADRTIVTAHRSDVAPTAELNATIALGAHVDLALDAGYTHNDSTIDAVTAGGDEGYDRLVTSVQLSYR